MMLIRLTRLEIHQMICGQAGDQARNASASYFLGFSILLSTIFRASSNAPAGVENAIVSARLNPSHRISSR
jgi:hypothetical protein